MLIFFKIGVGVRGEGERWREACECEGGKFSYVIWWVSWRRVAWRNVQYKYIVLTAMEENREWDEEQLEYQNNEIVWAKITGFPWWPAIISQKPHPPNHLYRVHFFTDNTHAFLNCHKIAKYEQLRINIDIGRQSSKGLRKAIVEADKALEQQKAQANAAEPALVAVEVINLKQKQLLQQSSTPREDLQAILESQQIQDSRESQQEEEGVQQEESSQAQKQESDILPFSRQQRQRFVKNLLKKYRLTIFPKCNEVPSARSLPKTAAYPLRRRQIFPRRLNNTRIKRSARFPHQKETLSFLLSRKIHQILKQKQGLDWLNSKEISLSLSHELLCGGGDAQEVNRLFKWLCISPPETIANFYQNWANIQSDKEKASHMTTQE